MFFTKTFFLIALLMIAGIISTFRRPYLGVLFYILIELTAEWVADNIGIELYVSLHMARIMIIVTLLAWFIHSAKVRTVNKIRIPQNIILLIFLGLVFLSYLFSGAQPASGTITMDFLKVVVFYFMLTNLINDEKKLTNLVWITVASTTFVAFQAYRNYESSVFSLAIPAWWVDKNDFATSIVIVIPLAFGLMRTEKSRLKKIFLFLAACGMILTVLRTYSRGGFVGLIAVLLLVTLHKENRLKKILFLVPFLIVLMHYAPKTAWDRIFSIQHYEKVGTAKSRFEAWNAGIRMMAHNPLLGVGPANFVKNFPIYAPEDSMVVNEWGRTMTAHNIFILIAGEIGVVGLSLFLLLLGLTFLDLIRLLIKIKKARLKLNVDNLLLCAGISLIGYCVCSLFLSQAYHLRLYLLIGIIVACKKIILSRNSVSTEKGNRRKTKILTEAMHKG